MKKYIRKIIVDDKKYIWYVNRNNCDGDGSNLITIWENKKQIYRELINGNIQITPLIIKKIIEEYTHENT